MQCPVCLSFLREDHLLGQVEASLTLQERAEMFQPLHELHVEFEADYDCREMLLATRKRQARIMSRLELHRARMHPIPA